MSPNTGTEKRAGAASHAVSSELLRIVHHCPGLWFQEGATGPPLGDCGRHVAVAVALSLACVALWLFSQKFQKLHCFQSDPFWSKVEALSCWCASKEAGCTSSPSRAGVTRPDAGGPGVGPARELGLELETTHCQTNSQNGLTGISRLEVRGTGPGLTHLGRGRRSLGKRRQMRPLHVPLPPGRSHNRRCPHPPGWAT